MKTALIVLTAVELIVLVAVLAAYLIAIAAQLRTIARTLGLVTFGVRAIEKQTEPIGAALGDVNGALEQVAAALSEPGRRPAMVEERTAEALGQGGQRPETSAGGS